MTEPENPPPNKTCEIVFNLHLLERCNFQCTYCFAHWATADQAEVLARPREGAEVVRQLVDAGRTASAGRAASAGIQPMDVRLNFVGGEPGLVSSLGDLIDAARGRNARTSVVTNGLLLKRFSHQFVAEGFDIVGISIDSTHTASMVRIGRATPSGRTYDLDFLCNAVASIRALRPEIIIKLNTVVSVDNCEEDLSDLIESLQPDRWKIMQVLPIYPTDTISESKFQAFVERHQGASCKIVIEDNRQMTHSYLMIDPTGRFFWNAKDRAHGYDYSAPILEVGAVEALAQVPIDWSKFWARYDLPPFDDRTS